jgi:hypothetical protein
MMWRTALRRLCEVAEDHVLGQADSFLLVAATRCPLQVTLDIDANSQLGIRLDATRPFNDSLGLRGIIGKPGFDKLIGVLL